ncbi:hypothetical protein [Schaalia hyovaginalis]|uniref:Uncharacterized protein n=1 Tax=Schaalia hyovaginalis TaxID=29316 RepID=A0A923IY27_9ACTO|nr:hypothetical protein [Schaalia hyovaginalis]MBB6333921.1 hypothetical protein [Schaalia hyovaginalis]MDY2669721.1 hypothetical protein [Schaalia hyovaginalis]
MRKRFRVGVVVAAMIGVLAGCAFGGGYVKQIPAALNEIEGVTSVEVGKGYDGLTRKTVIKIYLASDPVTAENIQRVFVALGDIDFSGAGNINLSFLNVQTKARSDVRNGVQDVIDNQGGPTGDYLPAALDYFARSAGLSISNPERLKEIADYMRD